MSKIILFVSLIVLAEFASKSEGATEGFEEVKKCLGDFKSALESHKAPNLEGTSAEQSEQLDQMLAGLEKLVDDSKDCFALAENLESQVTSAERNELESLFDSNERK